MVNRRYQRKLVWTIEEKAQFIDSILKGFPIPLILLASNDISGQYEIIDGLQRLNALTSFIDQEFSVNGEYFNLDTMADTKLKRDKGILHQGLPAMNREICAELARYPLPISIFSDAEMAEIDEVFRRLNSNGKHLSQQELRQAGSLTKFAQLVRKVSANIRGDSSLGDILSLEKIKLISITNRELPYGINAETVPWVKHGIMTKEQLRESKDEEVLADISAWILSDKALRSNSKMLDEYYGFIDGKGLSEQLELNLAKTSIDEIAHGIQIVFDQLIEVCDTAGLSLRDLIFNDHKNSFPRYFQIYFIAFFDLMIKEGKEVHSQAALIKALRKSADSISLSEGGGNWSSTEKENGINQVNGIIRPHFKKAKTIDPAKRHWITAFENILTNSTTEQTLYDFKVGLHDLDSIGSFNEDNFEKIGITLTAMANTLPGSVGYVVIGVADKIATAQAHEKIFKKKPKESDGFFVTGVEDEATKYHKDMDKYYSIIVQKIKNWPIDAVASDYILRNMFSVKYYGKTAIILSLSITSAPAIFGDKYWIRHGSNNSDVKPKDYALFFGRFRS